MLIFTVTKIFSEYLNKNCAKITNSSSCLALKYGQNKA